MNVITNPHNPPKWHLNWLRLQEEFIILDSTEQNIIEHITTRFPQMGIGLSVKENANEDIEMCADHFVQFIGWIQNHHIWKLIIGFSLYCLENYPITPSELIELWNICSHFEKLENLDVIYMPNIDRKTSIDRNTELNLFSQTPPVSINLDLIAGVPLKILHFYGPFKLEGDIASIPTLEQFGIEVDPYGCFYDGLSRLPHLHTLVYSDVIIDGKPAIPFPHKFTSMHQLKKLVLANVGLVSVPDCFDAFPDLESLGLQDNHLTSIPPSLFTLTRIHFSISGNQLARVPPAYRTYPNELYVWPIRSFVNLPLRYQLNLLEHPGWPPTLAELRDCWLSSRYHQLYIERRIELSDVQRELSFMIERLEQLYTEQWEDLYDRILKSPDTPLTEWEIERITFEATVGERQWLENHLPPHHPLILAFSEQYTILLKKDEHYSVLL